MGIFFHVQSSLQVSMHGVPSHTSRKNPRISTKEEQQSPTTRRRRPCVAHPDTVAIPNGHPRLTVNFCTRSAAATDSKIADAQSGTSERPRTKL